jgi:hypothetical protein
MRSIGPDRSKLQHSALVLVWLDLTVIVLFAAVVRASESLGPLAVVVPLVAVALLALATVSLVTRVVVGSETDEGHDLDRP